MPTRRQRSGALTASGITPMLDLFLLMLLVIMVNRPAFNVPLQSLPTLRTGETTASTVNTKHRIELRADGTTTIDGEQATLQAIGQQLGKMTNPNDKVMLLVNTTAGIGPVNSLLDLQTDLSRRQLWGRVLLAHRHEEKAATIAEEK